METGLHTTIGGPCAFSSRARSLPRNNDSMAVARAYVRRGSVFLLSHSLARSLPICPSLARSAGQITRQTQSSSSPSSSLTTPPPSLCPLQNSTMRKNERESERGGHPKSGFRVFRRSACSAFLCATYTHTHIYTHTHTYICVRARVTCILSLLLLLQS